MARAQKTESDAPPTEAEIKKAQQEMLEEIEKFGWSREGKGQLGNKAVVEIPKGYRFTKATGTQKMLQMYDNIPSNRELGMLTTEGLGPWIIFEFDETGYVKDDDKDELDADSLLKTLREGQEAGNAQRREMGIEELELLGWAVPPRYNSLTHNLEWATRVRSKTVSSLSIRASCQATNTPRVNPMQSIGKGTRSPNMVSLPWSRAVPPSPQGRWASLLNSAA
jgi:uncharacterized membrane-anchored protein